MKYKSLFDLWKQSCKKYFDLVAFTDSKKSLNITYGQAFRELCFLAEYFNKSGLKRCDKVSLFAVNFPRWLILEQAVITLGGICVSKTSEIDIKELDYVYTNSDSVALITDNAEVIQHFINKDDSFWDNTKFILYTGNDDLALEHEKLYKLSNILSCLSKNTKLKTDWEENPNDTAYINYTSGTSSNPKGAMLPNIGMSYVVEQLQKFNNIKIGKLFVGMFPLSSAGGKSVNLLCFSKGCTIMFAKYIDFYDILKKYKPDYFELAPKIIQTIHAKMIDYTKEKGKLFEQRFNFCYNIAEILLKLNNRKKFLFGIDILLNSIFDKYMFKQIRNTLFKDNAVLCIGSAHLAKPLEDFLRIMNIKFVQHYGLTETTGLAVSNTLKSQKIHPYSVGIPFNNTVLKIINPETHEELPKEKIGLITLQGPEILQRYYKNEEATKKAIFKDHFLNTGDLGYIDKQGYLFVLSRYDDVIVLSNGYNVYTPLLENEVKDSEYIKQLVIAGHGKPYLSALIVLNMEEYKKWCYIQNISCEQPNKNEEFKDFIITHINDKIKRKSDYKYYEQIKKVYFLDEEFTEANGMLTGTLKVKYQKVINTYQKEISKLYGE